jgi:hypothetical protein
LKVKPLFGGTCRLHLQHQTINQSRDQLEAGSKQSSVRLTFNGLHEVISEKVELFATTAVMTQNPTC